MLILRLKRCERALAGGRLEEAMQILLAADARAHRQGQALLDRLVGALVERGRGHLAEGRFDPAEADWHAAASLGGNTPAVAQLRSSLDQVAGDRRRAADERRRAKGAVDAFVRQGAFTLAKDAAAVAAVAGGGSMVADVEVHRAAVNRLADDVAAALAAGDWETAVDRIAAARSPGCDEPRVRQLKREVAGRIAEEAGRLIDAGRLDEAGSVLHRASALGPGLGEIDALRRGLDQCRVAWQSVRSAHFAHAREVLERLAVVFPGARWITTARAELGRACEAIEAVRGGTLGMLEAGDATVAFPAMAMAMAIGPVGGARAAVVAPAAVLAQPEAAAASAARASARRFLLHVDGAGSYVVLQGNRFEIGPVSASRPADLPLIVAPGSPVLTLSRSDDEYFLSSAAPVTVNDRAASGRLLASGDRIAVGPRGRIEFRRPNAASGTAVLRISGARLPWGGVREVLLMDREIVLGNSSAAHVRVGECAAPVILQVAADGSGGLICRGEETLVVDGRACGRSAAVGEAARVVVGAVSFVIRRE